METKEKERRQSMAFLKKALRKAERNNHVELVESYRATLRRLEENDQRNRRLNGRKGVSRPRC